ncbi:hypothetical protein IE53DRAFT_386052 [Violaceomyces palustris]|uniref:Uncharacterized protein n=1 Tax=Violaceomyces palustris TaxID=1673888 RepID=A0ACD0P0M5_9BASI|nr:hypothetical protein IE53DRAFT_386052 [Violaceomyces palustris]
MECDAGGSRHSPEPKGKEQESDDRKSDMIRGHSLRLTPGCCMGSLSVSVSPSLFPPSSLSHPIVRGWQCEASTKKAILSANENVACRESNLSLPSWIRLPNGEWLDSFHTNPPPYPRYRKMEVAMTLWKRRVPQVERREGAHKVVKAGGPWRGFLSTPFPPSLSLVRIPSQASDDPLLRSFA